MDVSDHGRSRVDGTVEVYRRFKAIARPDPRAIIGMTRIRWMGTAGEGCGRQRVEKGGAPQGPVLKVTSAA